MGQTGRKKKGVQDGSATGQPKAKLERLRPAGAKGEEKTASRRRSKYQKVLDTASNIAQHKNVEDELMREHNLLRTLIDSMPDEIYVKDTGSRFVLYNRAVARHRGAADAESLLGKTDFDLYPREEAEQCCAREQEIIRSGKGITNFLQKGFDQTGNEIIGLTTKAPLRDSKGEIVGVIGISRNVTEEKKAEKALMDERNLLRTLIDNTPDQIYAKDTAGHFLLCNEAVARQVGKTIDQVIGKTDFDLFDGKLAKVYAEEEAQVVRTGKPMINKETFGTDVSGRSGWALATKVPLKDSTGQVVGIVGINREITEIKQAQAEIQKLARFPSENPYPVLRIHKDGTVLYANKASEELLKARGSKVGGGAPAEWHRLVEEVLASGRVAREELEHQGRVFVFRVTPVAESDYVNFYGADITEQKQAEEEREVTIKLLRLINSNNGMRELMKLVSVFLRDWSGCEAVGIRLQEGEDFPYFVTSGFPEEFVLAESKLCSVDEIGQVVRDSRGRAFLKCMCGNIISGRFDPSKPFFTRQGSFWTNSTTDLLAGTNECDRLAKTRNRCNTAGYESVALVRLRAGKETFGLLQFNSKERNRFTAEKILLFERLADNLAIALAQRKAEGALAESEKRFRTLADESFDSIVIHDGGVVVEANKGFCDKWGYEKSEAAGLCVEDLIAKESLAAVKENIRRGWGKPYEALAKRKDGTTFPIEIFGKNITYKGRGVRIVTARDITERKHAEEKLKEAFDWQQVIFEGSRDAILITDEDSRFVTVNKAACELTGYSREELLKMRIPDLHDEQGLTGYRLYHDRIMAGEQILSEAKILRKDGLKVDTEFNNRRIEITGTRYMHTAARDITERKCLEETLEKERQELRVIIDSSPIIVFYKDREGRFARVNKAFAEALGIPEEKFLGKTVFDFYAAEIAQSMTNDDQEVFRTGRAKLNIIEQYESAKGLRWVQTDKVPIFGKDGILAGLVGFARDMTERKQAEQRLLWQSNILGAIGKIFHEALRCKTEEELGQFCLATAGEVAGTDVGFIAEVNPNGQLDTIAISTPGWELCNMPKDAALAATRGMEIRGIWGKVVKEAQPVLLNQPAGDPQWRGAPNGHPPIDSFLGVPLRRDGQAIGIIALANKQGGFTAADQQAVEMLSAAVVEAIDRKRAETALCDSETRYKELFDNMSSGVAVYEAVGNGEDFIFRDFNKAGQKIDGTGADKAIGRRVTEVFPGVREFGLFDVLQRVWRTGVAEHHPVSFYKDERIAGWRENYVYKLPSGEIVTVYEDVTDKVRAEEQLRQSEGRLSAALEAAGLGIWDWDMATGYICWGGHHEEIFGLARGEFDGRYETFENRVHPDDLSGLREAVARSSREHTTYSHEYRIVRPDGTIRWIAGRGEYIWDKDGKPIRMFGAVQDMTERRHAQEELLRLNKVMETITDVNQDIFRIKDRSEMLNSICRRISAHAYKMAWIGFCSEQTQRVTPEAQAGFEAGYLSNIEIRWDRSEHGMGPTGTAIRTGRPNVVRFTATDPRYAPWRKDAINRGYRSSAAIPIFGQDKVIGALNVYSEKEDAFSFEEIKLLEEMAHDISTGLRGIDEEHKRRQAEQKLLEYQKQLKSLAFQLAIAEERERRRIAGQLHDQVSQSLALAKIKVDSLRASVDAEQVQNVLDEVAESIEKVVADTRSLTFDISYPLLYELGFEAAVAEWLREEIGEKHKIETEFEDDGQPKPLDDDVRALLFRNVRELLVNVVKHARASKVKVTVRRDADNVQVTVEDDGAGFDPAEVHSRGHHRREFGLFSVRERLEHLGGRVETDSAPGRGCRITMTAPLKPGDSAGRETKDDHTDTIS